jgi:hypothetical protein
MHNKQEWKMGDSITYIITLLQYFKLRYNILPYGTSSVIRVSTESLAKNFWIKIRFL